MLLGHDNPSPGRLAFQFFPTPVGMPDLSLHTIGESMETHRTKSKILTFYF
jgi:hypothetical protein